VNINSSSLNPARETARVGGILRRARRGVKPSIPSNSLWRDVRRLPPPDKSGG